MECGLGKRENQLCQPPNCCRVGNVCFQKGIRGNFCFQKNGTSVLKCVVVLDKNS